MAKLSLQSLFGAFLPLLIDCRQRNNRQKKFTIALAVGDAVWLQGYTNLLRAIGEFALAHDGQAFFNALAHVAFVKPETPYKFLVDGRPESSQFSFGDIEFGDIVAFVHLLHFPIAEPAGMATALQQLQTTTALSRQSWTLMTAEKDNDREWLPNPKQRGVIPKAQAFPPYSTVYWHYKQWRAAGVFEALMSALHGQVREQVKKAPVDDVNHH